MVIGCGWAELTGALGTNVRFSCEQSTCSAIVPVAQCTNSRTLVAAVATDSRLASNTLTFCLFIKQSNHWTEEQRVQNHNGKDEGKQEAP